MDEGVQQSFDRDAVRDAVLALAQAQRAGTSDPAEDEVVPALTLALADLLGNVPARTAAEGIALAVSLLTTERELN